MEDKAGMHHAPWRSARFRRRRRYRSSLLQHMGTVATGYGSRSMAIVAMRPTGCQCEINCLQWTARQLPGSAENP